MSTTSTDTKKGNIYAGIDIGSNSLRLLIAEVKDGKITNIVDSMRATTRLAGNINNTGKLSDDAILKSVDVIKSFKQSIDNHNVKNVKAVATSAVREATNGDEFISKVKEVGVDIDVISGDLEASITLLGVKSGLDIKGNSLIFDIGGGSTEFIISDNNNDITLSRSYKLGVVKLTDMFDVKNNATNVLDDCYSYINDTIKDLTIPKDLEVIIATAGTATTLAAISMKMTEYDPDKINGYVLEITEIENILTLLVSTPYDKRCDIAGMDNGREDLIIPGILAILAVARKGGYDKVTVSDYGLREGAVIYASQDS